MFRQQNDLVGFRHRNYLVIRWSKITKFLHVTYVRVRGKLFPHLWALTKQTNKQTNKKTTSILSLGHIQCVNPRKESSV